MFKINQYNFDGIPGLEIKNTRNGEFITVFPDFGGMIHQVALQKNGQLYQIVDGCADSREMQQNDKARGAQLFPFANRVRDGKYNFAGKSYQMPINWPQEHHTIHGFVRDEKFAVLNQNCTDHFAMLSLSFQYAGLFEGYPFPFQLQIDYRLTAESGVIISTRVKNCGDSAMPCGDGWHCYFQTGSLLNKVEMQLPAVLRIETDERGIPVGAETRDSTWESLTRLEDTFLDTGYKILNNSGKSAVKLFDRKKDLTINIWQETGEQKYNYLQLYTPPSRQSIAVEPMTSKTDAFNNNDGVLVLQPGNSSQTRWGVSLT